MTNLEVTYRTVKQFCSDLDAIYEDYLVDLIGTNGLCLLKRHNLIESCGIVSGRKLYTLLDWKES